MFENRILSIIIFLPKREANGEWRKFDSEGPNSLYRSPNIVRVTRSRRLRWAGHVARMEEGRIAFKMFTNKISLGRPRRINRRNWVDSTQGKDYWRTLVIAALNLRVP